MDKQELLDCVAHMGRVRDTFYWQAIQTGCHPFIEFCGFMGEYVKVCEEAAREGIDFRQANTHTGEALPMKPWQAQYLAEKFDCIFGPSIRADAQVAKIFKEAIFEGAA